MSNPKGLAVLINKTHIVALIEHLSLLVPGHTVIHFLDDRKVLYADSGYPTEEMQFESTMLNTVFTRTAQQLEASIALAKSTGVKYSAIKLAESDLRVLKLLVK